MLKKEELEQLEQIHKEQEDLKVRIQKLESKPQQVVADNVKGSSKSYPYIQHNFMITGLEEDNNYKKRKNTIKKLKKIYKNNSRKLDKIIIHIEYELNKIEDSEIRQIIRHKYENNKNWIQIMYLMNYNSESTARMKIERFFEKNKNVRFVRN